jgi:hypothetical protein
MKDRKRIVFYSSVPLIRDTLRKRKLWKFNDNPDVKCDFVFRADKENKSIKCTARIKDRIIKTINGKYNQFKCLREEKYPHIPPTYLSLEEFDQNVTFKKGTDRWFYKSSDESCGKGVFMMSDRKSLKRKIKEKTNKYIVQKQVDPLLYYPDATSGGRKFDLRVFVLIDMMCNVYFHNNFLVRICKKEYLPDCSSTDVQLTNISQGALAVPLKKWNCWRTGSGVISSGVRSAISDLAPILKKYKKNKISKYFAFIGCDLIISKSGIAMLLEINDRPNMLDHPVYPEIGHLKRQIVNDMARHFIEPLFARKKYSTHNKGNWIAV